MTITNPGAVTIPTSSKRPRFEAPVLSGPIDPLAGITFVLRLQTHDGDNVPLGLYQDTACTIPATEDGHLIKAWKGELMGSPVTATQSDDQKAPMLVFDGGVPTVFYDGVDDELNITWNATIGSLFAGWGGVTNAGLAAPSVAGLPIGATPGARRLVTLFPNNETVYSGDAAELFGTDFTNYVNTTETFTFPASPAYALVSQIADTPLAASGAMTVGHNTPNSAFLAGGMTSVLIASAAISGADLTAVRNYLISINP